MRKANGDLHFYVNGRDQGLVTPNMKTPCWAVVDLYGKCAALEIYDPSPPPAINGKGVILDLEQLGLEKKVVWLRWPDRPYFLVSTLRFFSSGL